VIKGAKVKKLSLYRPEQALRASAGWDCQDFHTMD
jgi:hypothetical protein